MNNKIPCEVIRDLLPSYIDHLTSETSNKLITEHMKECKECKTVLSSMKGGLSLAEDTDQGRKELDFLKKNKKRNRHILLGSIAGAFLVLTAVLLANRFLIGNKNAEGWAAINLVVEGQHLQFDAVPTDSASAIAALSYTEEDGVITINARSVLVSPLHAGALTGSYAASEEIREVRIRDKIVWAEGTAISALASDLYSVRHDYVGDMPANGRVAQALNLFSYLGPYTNELETAAEPFGWRILLSDPILSDDLDQKEADMDAFGRVLVGLIGNLDHVTFVYTVNDRETARTITAADASAFLGEDIKNCGKNVRVLNTLLQKSGLSI